MIAFQPHGPFEVPILSGGLDKSREGAFWRKVEESEPGLPAAVGCYIFAIRAGRGVRPWYVGKTEAAFKKEVFQDHKFRLYWEALRERSTVHSSQPCLEAASISRRRMALMRDWYPLPWPLSHSSTSASTRAVIWRFTGR